jgi:uncharacterized membrane protein
LANLCLFALLLINLLGLALIAGLWLRNAWLALTAGPWLFCSLGFFMEGFHGFGPLGWILPITTAASVVLALEVTGGMNYLSALDKRWKIEEWKRELSPRVNPLPYGVFLSLFCYTMLWRYTFPDLDGSSEKLPDLAYICSYFPGETIPVHDVWLYPFLSTHYYSFQYYAAALLGRILGTGPGAAYNVSFCVLISLAGTAAIGAICQATRKPWIRTLVSAAWIFGGSGVTLIIHLVSSNPEIWESMRFVGSANMDKAPLGTFLADYTRSFTAANLPVPMDLPGEPLSYSIYLGDYHPPLSGYYLLTLALLALGVWRANAYSWPLVIVGATLPWCLVADTWNVPLQALGLAAWAFYNRTALRAGSWRCLLAGLAGGTVAIYPYFRSFALSATDYPTVIRWVPWDRHTPPLLGFLFLLPTFGMALLGLFSGRKPLVALGLLWLGFLFFSEFFYVNDIYSGQFLRFNTTLKWWPWIAAGTLLTLGPRLLELKSLRFIRAFSFILVAYPLFYVWDLGAAWANNSHKENFGRLDGAAYLASNHDHLLLDYLQAVPRGVVVEHPELDFTNTSAMTLLSGQQAYLGWMDHEKLWRGYLLEIQYRYDRLQEFYQGDMTDAGAWMRVRGVDYILWFKTLDADPLWDKVNASLHDDYAWHEFYNDRGHRIGLWERKNR